MPNDKTTRDPRISVDISEKMVEEVIAEWQRDNPVRTLADMDPDEFADRMMKKITVSARAFPDA